MSKTATRFKVPVATLLANAQKAEVKDKERYQKELERHEKDMLKWRAAAIALIKGVDAEKLVDNENTYSPYHSGGRTYLKLKVLVKPPEPRPPSQKHAKVIKLLRMATDETTTVSVNHDLAEYL